MSAEDIALGYKQLLEVERGWRDMKQILDLRPVYHRREDRVRAHVLLCWLALLLIRVAETSTGQTWNRLRGELSAAPRRHLQRPVRHLPPVNRDHQAPARHLQDPENRGPAPHLPAETPRRALTDEAPPPRYTPSSQSTAYFRTSTPGFAD